MRHIAGGLRVPRITRAKVLLIPAIAGSGLAGAPARRSCAFLRSLMPGLAGSCMPVWSLSRAFNVLYVLAVNESARLGPSRRFAKWSGEAALDALHVAHLHTLRVGLADVASCDVSAASALAWLGSAWVAGLCLGDWT